MSKNKYKNKAKTAKSTQESTKTRLSNQKRSSKESVDRSSILNGIMGSINRFLPLIVFVVFGIVAYIYLSVLNSDYLYSCQEHSIWQDTGYFFSDCMRRIGGFSEWLGMYFTQYFYYPTLGTLILILLWCLIYFLTMKVFRLQGRWSVLALAPCVFLLCSEIDLGYWLYYIKMPGYWFTYSIAILIMLTGIYVCRFLKGYIKPVYVLAYTLCLYPIIGIWSLIGALLIGIQELLSKDKARFVTFGLSIVGCIASPLLHYGHYTTSRSEDIWTVLLPNFQADKFVESSKALPFIGVIIVFLALVFIGRYLNKDYSDPSSVKSKKPVYLIPLINICLCVFYFFIVSFSNVDDKNFHSELRMYKSLGECDWDGVLAESAQMQDAHTRQMILCQNIAMLHKGDIGDMMFKYNNKSISPRVSTYKKSSSKLAEDMEKVKAEDMEKFNGDLKRDSLHVNLCNTAGPLIYFMHGKCNFAYRWCIENGVEFTFRVDEYKNMVRCAMMTGEDKLARKYLEILSHTTFHKDWASERLSMLHDKNKYTSSIEYKSIKPLYDSFKNALDGDQGLCELYLISYFCHMNSDDPKFQEATLAYALIQKDISLFWPRFFKYADLHEKEMMPIHYQEAAYLFGHLENQVDISKMPFDKDKIVNRYASFTRMTSQLMQMYGPQYQGNEAGLTKRVGDECFAEFGDTYWWFYYFSRNVHTY